MARWKLTEPHYLNVPGTEWEQVITDRVTQRPIRKKYIVPLHLDPRIESDWTHRDERGMDGEIIVCWEGKGLPRDITFAGSPTPGMLPLDDEARAESAKYTWTPTATVDTGYGERPASEQGRILDNLIQKLADATVSGMPSGTAPAGFEKFMESMAAMMQQQTQLLAMLLEKNQKAEFEAQARALGAEGPAELDEPLPEVEGPTEKELKDATKAAFKADAASAAKAQAHAEAAVRRV